MIEGKRMRNKKLAILSAVILSIIVFIIFRPCSYPPMTGTVVDAETGKPIEGAVVLVEWTKTHGIGEHWTESFKVEESVTDREGKFTITGIDSRNRQFTEHDCVQERLCGVE